MLFFLMVLIGVGVIWCFVEDVWVFGGFEVVLVVGDSWDCLIWYLKLIDSNYLIGKCVFIFGDVIYGIVVVWIVKNEFGFKVCGFGIYMCEFVCDVCVVVKDYGVELLIIDDYLVVEDVIIEVWFELVLGIQMECYIVKCLCVFCVVIFVLVYVQDFLVWYFL